MDYYIELNDPKSINGEKLKNDIDFLIQKGVKTNEIILCCTFIAPENVLNEIFSKFRKLKNKARFDYLNN